MEIFGLLTAVSAVSMTLTWALLSVAAPVLWLWMLIDALLREEHEYPGATPTSNNRVLWVLLIAFVQLAALPYFFVVYGKVRRGSVARTDAVPQAA
ncbi:MAG: hypothetical protein Q7W51_00645 [Coriobacteriia bacterium]|nr:hypothetical protein [Coriobacteriia bacterium]